MQPQHHQLPPQPPLSRKRSAARSPSPDEDFIEENDAFDTLKRTKTDGELEELAVAPLAESWRVDVTEILAPTPQALQTSGGEYGAITWNGLPNYTPEKSLLVLCVVGSLEVQHYALR